MLLHRVFDNPPCFIGLLQLPATGVFPGHHPQPLSDLGHPGHLIFEGLENPKSEFLGKNWKHPSASSQCHKNGTSSLNTRDADRRARRAQKYKSGRKTRCARTGQLSPDHKISPLEAVLIGGRETDGTG